MKFRQNYGEDRTRNKNGVGPIQPNPLILLARLEGFEPPTHGLEVRSSIHLSYRRNLIISSTYKITLFHKLNFPTVFPTMSSQKVHYIFPL